MGPIDPIEKYTIFQRNKNRISIGICVCLSKEATPKKYSMAQYWCACVCVCVCALCGSCVVLNLLHQLSANNSKQLA